MSIKAYTSIAESYNISNYFDLYDESFNKIRFSIKDQQLYITSYNPNTGAWTPANVIFDTSPIQTTSLIDFQDILSSSNIRIQLDAGLPANGKEVLVFEKDANYNYIKRSGLNYAIDSSPYLPTVNLDDRIVIYRLDSNGKPQFTLSQMSTTALAALYVTLADNQTITGAKKFNANKLLLAGTGGNVTLNGSQVTGSSSYILEYPTAAPAGVLNILTTSGSSPYSKLTWADLGTYAALSAFDQLTALKTNGSPTFANLTIAASGALNLNYMSTPASSDILATLNTNKQLTNSGVALSSLCTLGTAQIFTADKTFNYSAGKIKLANYSTDNTTTNNLLTINASGYIVPCNKLYSDVSPFSVATAYTFTATQTFNASSNPIAINNLTTSLNTGTDVLLSLDTSGNVKKTDVLYSKLSSLATLLTKIPIYQFKYEQNLSSSGSSTYTATSMMNSPTYNASGKYGYALEPMSLALHGGYTALNSSAGNNFSLTGWVRVNAVGKSLRIRFDTGGDQTMEFMMSDSVMPNYVGNGAYNGFDLRRFASDISKSQWVQTTMPNFNNTSDINKWWFFGFSWNSSTSTLSLYITDGGANTYSDSESYPTKSSTFNSLFRNLGGISFQYTTAGTFVDDIRIYNSVLSTSEFNEIAQSSTDVINSSTPSMLLDTTEQTIKGAKTFNLNTLLLNGGGSSNVTLNAPSISSAYTWTLPASNPTSGTTNVLMTSSTSSPYSLSWTDLAATYLTQASATSTYMKLSGTQTNSGVNTWSGNNTFNQDKLLLPTLTTTASGTNILTKNASTGAVETASVAWNNINLINSAQTITADKTFNYSSGKIKLSNYSADNTTTNNILTINSNGYIVPCNKLYSDISSSQSLAGVSSDTAISSGQKLAVINTTSNNIERINITPDTIITTTGAQTITGDKVFTGTTKIEKLYCNGLFAKDTLTQDGTASWTGRYLTWTGVLRLLPINKPELALTGFINLDIPTVGQQFTVYSYSNMSSSSLVSMTSNGFDFNIAGNVATTDDLWTALYYKINLGQDQNDVSTNYILVHHSNTAWEPDTTWILLAVANSTTKALKWVPGMVDIPSGGSYTPTDTLMTTNTIQTITGNKTFNYTTSKIALTNSTNDNTTTNKVLVLNASNQIVPCDKTYSSIGSGGGGSSVYNGYAVLPSSVGNKKTSIIVTNPLSSASITVTANVSKTLDGDGNYVQFDNVLTTITSANITFYISGITDWVVDSANAYTLFYSIIANPGTNQAYSFGQIAVPNLVNYFNFENGSGTNVDLIGATSAGSMSGTYTTTSVKYGTYGFIPSNGTNPSYYAGTTFSFCVWIKFSSGNNYSPYLHTSFDGSNWSDLNNTAASLTSGIGTIKLTWAGQTSATINYNGTIFNHLCITATAGGNTELYWNGVQLISTSIANLSGTLSSRFITYFYGNNEVFDDLRVYNRILTASEVAGIAGVTSPSNILTSKYSYAAIQNLVSYWNFNSNITDQAGSQAFTGTPTYNTSVFKYGTAAVNKTSASLSTTLASYVGNYGLSISFWMYNVTNAPLTINPAALTELNINTTNVTSTTYQLGISGGTLTNAQYSGSIPYSSSKWIHVSVIIDFIQKTICLYSNGNSVLTYTASDTYFAASSWTAPVISLNKNGSANIDELRIYNRVLTDIELGHLYNYAPISITANTVPSSTTTTLSTATSTETLVAVDSSGIFKNSAIPFSGLSELKNIAKTPIYHFKFEQNLNSAGSSSYGGASSGTFTYNASGKYGYGVQATGALTSALTAMNTSSGNSATVCGWVKVNTTTSKSANGVTLRIKLAGTSPIYLMMNDDAGIRSTTFNNCFYLDDLPGYSTSYSLGFGLNNPDFSQSANINKWWFYAYTWDSANLTLGLYFSDGGANTYSTTKVFTAGDSTFTNSLNTKFRNITTVDFQYTSSDAYIDDLRFYNTVLSSTELAALATASSPDAVSPSVIFNTTAQTISSAKTIDYSLGSLALSNTTNDTTSTNKILTLNASTNKVIPCDKTYADVFKPQALDIYDSTGSSYARLLINSGALSIQYYVNGTISGSPYALTVPVLLPAPAIAWNFNTNLSSTYSTSGTYTLSSGTISANGKFSNCLTSGSNDLIVSPEITPLTRATGNSYTVSYWFKISSWTSNDWRAIELKCFDSNTNFLMSNVQDPLAVAIGGTGNTAPTANITTTIFTTTSLGMPPFIGSSVYNNWNFCALRWDDALTTLSVIYYIGGTKYTQSSVITNSSHLSIIRTCTRYNSASGVIAPTLRITGIGTKSGIDDVRIWPTALSDNQIAAVYNSTTDVL